MKPRKKFVKPMQKPKQKVKPLKQKPKIIRKTVTQQQQKVKQQSQSVSQQHTIVIPGITGPLIPAAHADPFGALRWIPKKQAIGVLKGMFGMAGKDAGVTSKKNAAAFLKAKRKIERDGGQYQFFLKSQTGMHVPKKPQRVVWSQSQRKKVAIDPLYGVSSFYGSKIGAEGTPIVAQKADPGAAKAWYETLFITAKGPAEAGGGGMKDKVSKLISKSGETKRIDDMFAFNFGYSGKNLPKEGIYTDLSGNLVSASRIEQGRVAGSWKPKSGETYTAKMLPEGTGIQTKYIKWREQSGTAPVIAKGKDDNFIQTRKVTGQDVITTDLKKEKIDIRLGSMQANLDKLTVGPWGSKVDAFTPDPFDTTTKVSQTIPVRGSTLQQSKYKGTPTGTTTAVKQRLQDKELVKVEPGKVTGFKSLPPITKLQKRQVRKDVLAGNISTAKELRVESFADRAFANAVNSGTLKLDRNMDLSIWQRLDYKQKGIYLQAKGLI